MALFGGKFEAKLADFHVENPPIKKHQRVKRNLLGVGGDMPFDGKRMFWGGFEPIVRM